MSEEFFRGAERILSATANGVYQGVAVTVLVALALRFLVRTNAATRHAVWFATLLFVTALIPAHLILSLKARLAVTPSVGGPGLISCLAATPSAENADQGSVAESDYADWQSDEFDALSIDNVPAGGTGREPVITEPAAIAQTGNATKSKGWLISALALIKRSAWNIETAISLPHWVCLCLVLAWAVFAGARAGLLAGRVHDLRRSKGLSESAGPRLQALFNRLRDSMVRGRDVRLRISNAHRGALVLGFAHPVVLLPSEMDNAANDGEVEHVLRHELAHVERRDDWTNLGQQAVQAALFFHPAVWWICKKLSLEREIACDDHVLEASARARDYALTLANVASRMNYARQLLAPGVSNNKSHLQQRINMILNTKRDRSPRLARLRLGFFTTATAILAALAINALPRLVLAQQPAAVVVPDGGDIGGPGPGFAALRSPRVAAIPGTAPTAAVPAIIAADTVSAAALPGTIAVEAAPSVGVSARIAVVPDPTPVTILTGPNPGSTITLAGQPGVSSYLLTAQNPAPTVALDYRPGVLTYAAGPSAAVGGSWSDDESGPRSKAAIVADDSAPDAPTPPMPPMPAMRPGAPVPAVPPAGVRAAKRHLSVEERLDRIERMLEDLEARGAIKSNRRLDYGYQVVPDGESFYRAMPPKPAAEYPVKRADEARASADQAQAAAADMRRAMEMGQRAAEKARRDMEKLKSKDLEKLQEELRGAESENSETELNALRDARDSLRSQVQTLEQQIKRLEEDRNRLDKPHRSNGSEDGPKNKIAPEAR